MPIQHTNKGNSVENDFDCRSKLMWQANLDISQTAQRNAVTAHNDTTDDEDDRHMQSIS